MDNRKSSEVSSVARSRASGTKSPMDRKRSYLAMILSMIIPGLGQFYLRKPWEGLMYLVGVLFAGGLIYINSYPVTGWCDLTQLQSSPDLIFIGKFGGTKLMFRPIWQFKISGLIQGVIFWFYAIYDGWEGQRKVTRRGHKKKVQTASKWRAVEKRGRLMSPSQPVKPAKSCCHSTPPHK